MNKPKIYGFCQAGCKWETVHKTDFDNSVTYIKQTAIDGVYYLDPIANYKIYSGVQSNAYTCQIKLTFKRMVWIMTILLIFQNLIAIVHIYILKFYHYKQLLL